MHEWQSEECGENKIVRTSTGTNSENGGEINILPYTKCALHCPAFILKVFVKSI